MSSFLGVRRRVQPKIFISYRRRGEGAGYGGRLADKLVEHFGAEQCFRDIASIESGVDFVQAIHEAVGACEVLIAVIGPDWISQTDDRGRRRLDDPRDFVRLEVAAALERGIRVIPVLVGGAEMPADGQLPSALEALSRRQAHEVTDSRWDYDAGKLVESIEAIGIRPRAESGRRPRTARWKLAAGIAGIAFTGLVSASLLSEIWSGSVPDSPALRPPAAVTEILKPAAEEPEAPERPARPVRAQPEDRKAPNGSIRYESVKTSGSGTAGLPGGLLDEVDKVLSAISVAASQGADSGSEKAFAQKFGALQASDGFEGLRGRTDVTWQHEGVEHNAVIVGNGSYGIARVRCLVPNVGILEAEQDLNLVRNADGIFYVGSNARVPGTSLPHPVYTPDIFRLGRSNGSWTITEVGTSWDHFDQAVTGGRLSN